VGHKSRLEDTHTNFMTERIINTAALAGYYVLVYQVRDLGGREERKKISDMFSQCRIDAGVFVGFPNSCDLIEDLVGRGFVAGVFNQHLPGAGEPNRILVQLDYSGINELVDYAAGLGHRDIMFLSGDMVRQSGVDIFQVFRQGMARNGLTVREDLILSAGEFTKTHAAAAFASFMEGRRPMPSCIICANDTMAFGVLDVLRLHGLRVPDDVSIIGSDDILVSQYFDPPLTTMAYDFDEMMKTLTAKVMEYVEHPFGEQFIATYSGRIVVRDSCRRNG
jgi:LacI family transcriptional regulator